MFDQSKFAAAMSAAATGVPYTKISELIDVSPATISRILNGNGCNDINKILRICKWMNKNINEFII